MIAGLKRYSKLNAQVYSAFSACCFQTNSCFYLDFINQREAELCMLFLFSVKLDLIVCRTG